MDSIVKGFKKVAFLGFGQDSRKNAEGRAHSMGVVQGFEDLKEELKAAAKHAQETGTEKQFVSDLLHGRSVI